MSASIRVRIDRLVLDRAFADLDREALGAAVEAELTRLLADGGIPSGLGGAARTPAVDAGRVEPDPRGGADDLGRRVARGVYRGLGR